ncbi:hypothetical protein [Streptomyces griseomycini]|nr:hypothetical protein [Streptomyces griseomycini]GGP84667.1 hypothetical protein GCM10010266_03410 [Streptomyces griseomycini]GGR02050.1 hypothetical protein GCM10015536_03540 [Streptomyces griseomycini]
MNTRAGGRWLVAALSASAVLASGCTAPVDPDQLPGVYRDDATGGEILLDSDGTFSATDVSTDGSSDPADFSGRWEFVDSPTSDDFVYLAVEDGGLGRIGGVQLYPDGRSTLEFHADPDGPPSLVLTRATAP